MSLQDARESKQRVNSRTLRGLSTSEKFELIMNQFEAQKKAIENRTSRLIKADISQYSESFQNFKKASNRVTKNLLSEKGYLSKSKFEEVAKKAAEGNLMAQRKIENFFAQSSTFTAERPKGVNDTSTVKGAKKARKEYREKLKLEKNSKKAEKLEKTIWRLFHDVFSRFVPQLLDSNQVERFTKQFVENTGVQNYNYLLKRIELLDNNSLFKTDKRFIQSFLNSENDFKSLVDRFKQDRTTEDWELDDLRVIEKATSKTKYNRKRRK